MKNRSPKRYGDTARHLLDKTAHKMTHHGYSVALRVVVGLIFLIVLGSILLMLPGMAVERPLTPTEAIFTATSALTVTGLSIITPGSDLTLMGKIVLLALIQVGGVGFMFIAVILLQILGRRVLLYDRLALSDSLGLDSPRAVLTLVKRTLIGVLAIEAIGAILLWVNWMRILPPATALGYAIFHAISAFCNAGFDLFHGTQDINGVPFNGIPRDNFSLAIMGTLILMGGLGIPVISEVLSIHDRKRFSLNTRITLVVVAGLTMTGWIGLFISEVFTGSVLAGEPLSDQLMQTLFQSISNRTAGFAGLPQFHRLSHAGALLIIVMMFVGCAPASMGGGITTGTFSVLMISLIGYVRGYDSPRLFNRTVDAETRQRAGAILTIALVLLIVSTWLILISNPTLGFEEVLFEVASAFATCGLSLGITSDLNGFGKLIIMILMFWGRLGPLTVVIALAQNRRKAKNLVQYPEEQILIG